MSLKMKIYVKDNTEVYEAIDTTTNYIIASYKYPLGTTFIDFIYSDYEKFSLFMHDIKFIINKVYDDNYSEPNFFGANSDFSNSYINSARDPRELSELSTYNSLLIENHIFYFMYYIYNDKINDYYAKYKNIDKFPLLKNEETIIKNLIKTVKVFISKCLLVDTNNDITSIERFMSMIENSSEYGIEKLVLNLPSTQYSFYPEQEYKINDFSNEKLKLSQAMYPESVDQIVHYLMIQQIQNGTSYNICKNCGKYFVHTGHKNVEYCERVIKGSNKTCKQVGASKKYRSKKKENPIFVAYNKAYNTRNARIKYGIITREEFKKWSKEARVQRDKCYNGEVTLSEFLLWLDKN